MAELRFSYSAMLAVILVITPIAAAQTHTVRGLACPVDEVIAVDSKNSRVVVQGKSFLVPRNEVDDLVVAQCLTDPFLVKKIPSSAVIEFTERAFVDKDVKYAEAGIQGMILHGKISQDQWLEFLSRVAHLPEFVAVVRHIVENSRLWTSVSNSIKAPILFEIGSRDAIGISQANVASSVTLSREFHEYAERGLADVIRTRKFSRLPQISNMLREFYGVEDLLFQQTKILSEQLDRFKQALDTHNAADVEITLLSLQKFGDQRQVLYPYFVEEIHRVVREQLDSGANVRGLGLLALVDLSFRTPTTHALAKLCLERISEADSLVLDQPTIKRFLLALIQFDPPLKELFERKLASQFRAALYQQDISQAERVIQMIVAARPDPNVLNDQIRIEFAKKLRSWGLYSESYLQLKAVQTGLPFLLRVDIFTTDQLGISLFNFVALSVSGLLLIMLLVIRYSAIITSWRRKGAKMELDRSSRSAVGTQYEDDDGAFITPGFRRMQKSSPEKLEYLRCLEVFGLAGDAPFKDIRQAYRQAVKTYHPDRQGEGKATDKFVDLNQTYERILELRVILGLEDE